MFELADIRKTASWREAYDEGVEKGFEKGFERGFERGFEKGEARAAIKIVRKWLAKGKSVQQIAELLDVSLTEARRLPKNAGRKGS